MSDCGGPDPEPSAEASERAQRWYDRAAGRDNEIPVVLPWSAVLTRRDELAVALVGAWVYRTGVEYSDGRHASNLPPPPDPAAEDLPAEQPVLHPTHGSGGGRRHDTGFFLSPLPPAGGLNVYCAWPAQGLPETRTVFDTDDLAAAAERVEVLWPEPPPSSTIVFSFG